MLHHGWGKEREGLENGAGHLPQCLLCFLSRASLHKCFGYICVDPWFWHLDYGGAGKICLSLSHFLKIVILVNMSCLSDNCIYGVKLSQCTSSQNHFQVTRGVIGGLLERGKILMGQLSLIFVRATQTSSMKMGHSCPIERLGLSNTLPTTCDPGMVLWWLYLTNCLSSVWVNEVDQAECQVQPSEYFIPSTLYHPGSLCVWKAEYILCACI